MYLDLERKSWASTFSSRSACIFLCSLLTPRSTSSNNDSFRWGRCHYTVYMYVHVYRKGEGKGEKDSVTPVFPPGSGVKRGELINTHRSKHPETTSKELALWKGGSTPLPPFGGTLTGTQTRVSTVSIVLCTYCYHLYESVPAEHEPRLQSLSLPHLLPLSSIHETATVTSHGCRLLHMCVHRWEGGGGGGEKRKGEGETERVHTQVSVSMTNCANLSKHQSSQQKKAVLPWTRFQTRNLQLTGLNTHKYYYDCTCTYTAESDLSPNHPFQSSASSPDYHHLPTTHSSSFSSYSHHLHVHVHCKWVCELRVHVHVHV